MEEMADATNDFFCRNGTDTRDYDDCVSFGKLLKLSFEQEGGMDGLMKLTSVTKIHIRR
jgi:hypothetical protein